MTSTTSEEPRARGMSLGTQVLIGVLAGIAVGVFLGELAAPFQIAGDVFIGLLQMTVLPYIVISLISKIGAFTYDRARELARHGTAVLLLLWAVSLGLVVLMPLSLPAWEAGSFFSSSLVEAETGFDFLDLYIPTNPFRALAENIVPAAVVFSILLGVALIPIESKSRLLDPLRVISDALGNLANGVIRLSPYGTFALAAGAAGTASPGELLRLGGYVSTFTLGVILLTFVVLPALVAAVTPFSYTRLVSQTRATLLTAFATGKLFAVLPMIIGDVRQLLVDEGMSETEAEEQADVLVPLSYPFPNAGKILAILFIPFAGWYTGQPFGIADYPLLLSLGMLSFFGSPVVAIPFLLDLFRMPADLLALFLISGIWGARFGDLLGVMHLTSFSLLTVSSEKGWLRFSARRVLALATGTAVAVFATLWVNHAVVSASLAGEPEPANRVEAMRSYFEIPATEPGDAPVEAAAPGETILERVERTGVLRVGFLPGNPPFSYRNRYDEVVGLEIDLLHRLAVEIDARMVLVPFEPGTMEVGFADDRFDLAVGGLASLVRDPTSYRESAPYLDLNAAFVIPDHRVEEFGSLAQVRAMDRVRVGYVEGGPLVRTGRHRLPQIEMVGLPSDDAYLTGERPDIDVLLTTAEAGAIHAMTFPEYSVVVPEGLRVRIPTVVAVADDEEFARTADRFIQIKRADGTVEALHEHWILGGAATVEGRRWSVLRDVLGWGR